jgi:hypothetical protein
LTLLPFRLACLSRLRDSVPDEENGAPVIAAYWAMAKHVREESG